MVKLFSKRPNCRYGYAQKEGINYNKVFSPDVKHSSIRILLALIAQHDLELNQLNVKINFLHGDLDDLYDSVSRVQSCRT